MQIQQVLRWQLSLQKINIWWLLMKKIEEYKIILSLYQLGENIIEKNCEKKQCRSGKSICLDEEQMFLLDLLIDNNMKWNINNGKIEKTNEAVFFKCNDSRVKNTQLVHLPMDEKELKDYITNNFDTVQQWKNVCEPIMVILGINASYRIMDRKSLLRLCLNSQSGPAYFRRLLMKVLSLLILNWDSRENMKTLADFIGNFLNCLSKYGTVRDARLSQNIVNRRNIICRRLAESTTQMDILYHVFHEQNDISKERAVDVLEYFADMEGKKRFFYVSRIHLIKYILQKKGILLEIPNNFLDFHKETEMPDNNRKICEIIDAIANQDDMDKRESWSEKLAVYFENSIDGWIDEEIRALHKEVKQ